VFFSFLFLSFSFFLVMQMNEISKTTGISFFVFYKITEHFGNRAERKNEEIEGQMTKNERKKRKLKTSSSRSMPPQPNQLVFTATRSATTGRGPVHSKDFVSVTR